MRYSMDHYAEDLRKSLYHVSADLTVDAFKMTSHVDRHAHFSRALFYIEKYIVWFLRFFQIMRNYDVVHIVDQSYGYLALVNLFLGKKIRIVVTVHDLIPLCYTKRSFGLSRPVRASVMYKFSIWSLRFCDALIFPSEFSARVYRRFNSSVRNRTYIVRQGCQLHELTQDCKPKWHGQCQSGKIVLGFILGEAYKNSEYSIRVADYLSSKYTVDLKILGVHNKSLLDLLKNSGKMHSVEFYSSLSQMELVDYYKSLDVFLFPSEIEGLGLPFIEGLLIGVPVFASAIPVLEEITNENYPTFPASDPASDPAEIDKFLALFWDKKKGKELLKTGWQCASQFNWNIASKQIFQIYRATM